MKQPMPALDALTHWSPVFFANALAPFLVALLVAPTGLLGIVAGVLALWGAGAVASARPGRLRAALLAGGRVVAILQFLPVAQLVAAAMAMAAWKSASGEDADSGLSNLGAFVVTILTGQPLVLLALLIGSVAVWRGWVGVPPQIPSPTDD